jgi:hypothetical protein
MNIKKTALTLLILVAGMFGGLVLAQQRTDATKRPQKLDAAELEKLSLQPSLEQAILKLAAEKARQEKGSTPTIELPITVSVTKFEEPCHHRLCSYSPGGWRVCFNIMCRTE